MGTLSTSFLSGILFGSVPTAVIAAWVALAVVGVGLGNPPVVDDDASVFLASSLLSSESSSE